LKIKAYAEDRGKKLLLSEGVQKTNHEGAGRGGPRRAKQRVRPARETCFIPEKNRTILWKRVMRNSRRRTRGKGEE